MLHMEEQEQGVQAIRSLSQERTVNVITHYESVKKEIVLWEDVLVVFPDTLYLQHKSKALPFLKGPDLKAYVPQEQKIKLDSEVSVVHCIREIKYISLWPIA